MAEYLKDPNYLIRDIREVNATAHKLRDEGWTVTLGVAENGHRIWVTLERTDACDPPKREDVE